MLYEIFSVFFLKTIKKLNENKQNININQAVQANVGVININDFQRLNLVLGIGGGVILLALCRKIFSLTPEEKA